MFVTSFGKQYIFVCPCCFNACIITWKKSVVYGRITFFCVIFPCPNEKHIRFIVDSKYKNNSLHMYYKISLRNKALYKNIKGHMIRNEVIILPMTTLNANVTTWITFRIFNGVINELSVQVASLPTSWNHLHKTLRNITWKLRRSALSCFIAASNVLMCF